MFPIYMCNRCARRVGSHLAHSIRFGKGVTPFSSAPLALSTHLKSIHHALDPGAHQKRKLLNFPQSSSSRLVSLLRLRSNIAEQTHLAEYAPHLFNFAFDVRHTSLDLGDGLDISQTCEVVSANLDCMTPSDVCLAVNKLCGCIWAMRGNVRTWQESLQVLHSHEVLPKLCNLIEEHAPSMSNAEALNVLYLLVKFGDTEVTPSVIKAVYNNLSVRVSSFELGDAALFVRCTQSVKDIIPTYQSASETESTIMPSVISHVQEILLQDTAHDTEALSRLLLGLVHCNIDHTHSVIQRILQELNIAIAEMDTCQLSPLCKAIYMLNRHHSPFAGRMLARVSDILDDITSPIDFSHIFLTLIGLSSKALESRMTATFLRLYVDTKEEASYGFNDLRRMMQGAMLMTSRENRNTIMTAASQLLIPQVPAIPPIELAIIYSHLRKVYSTNYELRTLLEEEMKRYLQRCDTPNKLLSLIEVLSHEPGPELKTLLISKATQIIPHLSMERLGQLCNAMGRMRVKYGKVPTLIEARIQENIDMVTNLTLIKNVTHFLASSRSTNGSLWSVLIGRLHTILAGAVTPGSTVFALDALSNLSVPLKDIDPTVWDKLLNYMPKLKGNDLRRVFFVLSAYSTRLHPHTDDAPNSFCRLLELIREPLNTTEVEHQQIEEDDQATNLPRAAGAGHALDISWIRDIPAVIALTKLLIQHRIYSQQFLSAIESTIRDNMDDLSPFHVRDVLDAFTISNHHPSDPDFLQDLCTSRIMPYMSDLQPQRLVSLALHLVALQYYPAELLQTIFSVEFLKSMEETYVSRNLSRQLQELNRAVCVECPEQRVPWFTYDEVTRSHSKPLVTSIKQDMEVVLEEVLGGPEFLRKNAQTLYAHTIDFECLLNQHGEPVKYSIASQQEPRLSDRPGHMTDSVPIHRAQLGSPATIHRVAIDVIPPLLMCSNVHRYSSWVEMKRRHLEILGYEYITVPYTDWSRDQVHGFQAKRLYISDLLGGNLWTQSSSSSLTPQDARFGRKKLRTNEMVEKILEEWGEDED